MIPRLREVELKMLTILNKRDMLIWFNNSCPQPLSQNPMNTHWYLTIINCMSSINGMKTNKVFVFCILLGFIFLIFLFSKSFSLAYSWCPARHSARPRRLPRGTPNLPLPPPPPAGWPRPRHNGRSERHLKPLLEVKWSFRHLWRG